MSEPQPDITMMLLQDAQQEIGNLRAELFRTRQQSEDRRQLIERAQAENLQLQESCRTLQAQLYESQQRSQQLAAVEQQVQLLNDRNGQLQRDLAASTSRAAECERLLQAEAKAKQAAEQARSKLEYDKARLQKARDELAAQVRLAQQKARDAEEEQCRAEDDAAALRKEVHALQAGLVSSQGGGAGVGAPGQLQVDLAAELEAERQRTTSLYNTLTATKADLQRRSRQLDEAQQQLLARDSQLHDAEEQLSLARQRLQEAEDELASCVARINDLQRQQPTPSPAPSSSSAPGAGKGALPSPLTPVPFPALSSSQMPDSPGTPLSHLPRLHTSLPASQSAPHLEELSLRAQESALLAKKVAAMKVARDKLLVELDLQMMEVDRLALENRSLGAEVLELREHCAAWESQAQAAIAQLDRLKDVIEESAAWGAPSPEPPGQQQQEEQQRQQHLENGGAHANGSRSSQEVMQQVARCTELDIQVRALCAELARARGGTAAMGRSLLPVLQGVELRLEQLRAGAAAPNVMR